MSHSTRRRRNFGRRAHELRELKRRGKASPGQCDHTGIGQPGCPTCDPAAKGDEQ